MKQYRSIPYVCISDIPYGTVPEVGRHDPYFLDISPNYYFYSVRGTDLTWYNLDKNKFSKNCHPCTLIGDL